MEGSFTTSIIQDYFKKEGIELYLTRGHAPMAERFVRTYKQMLHKRIEHDEKKEKKIYNGQIIILKYYFLLIIKWFILQLDTHPRKQDNPKIT